ncbi:MAG: threonine synthase [Ruminococcaceae bacterium]|nr:threonine synthase [Oscillospiraceae bacterium]
MNYVSTRGQSESVSSAMAIKQGIAPDGGLYMPESIPALTEDMLRELCELSYSERAAKVMSLFLSDYTYDELLTDCKLAYGDNFDGYAAPVVNAGDKMRVLELWHGPTCAFKDMALQIMPRLLSRALVKTGEERTALILVATSGDTGKAALEGYRDVERTKISVYYPVNGVSRAQKLQMTTQEGSNVNVCAISGNFDDAQSGVKKIFANRDFAAELDKKGYFLSSANSINWGRLVPQTVYYVSAWCDLVKKGDIAFGDKIDICVPTGNFGNILAAFLAKKMGLPVGRFVCASNSNNVLTDFFRTGTYDRNRDFHVTVSPSMDILISSNLERLLYLTAGAQKTRRYMEALAKDGKYTLDKEDFEKIISEFDGYYTSEDACTSEIKSIFDRYSYLVDTHTAVALDAAERYLAENKNAAKRIVIASTASPYKFAPAVARSLGIEVPEGDAEIFSALSGASGTKVPTQLSAVLTKEIRFKKVIDPEEMQSSVLDFIS